MILTLTIFCGFGAFACLGAVVSRYARPGKDRIVTTLVGLAYLAGFILGAAKLIIGS